MQDEWIELDLGGARLTHIPSGETYLRHPYMRMMDESVWNDKVRELAARHPRADKIVNSRRVVVGSLRDHVAVGTGFEVGDTLLLLDDADRSPTKASIVVSVEAVPGLPWSNYTLDDGSVMYWNDDFNGWFSWDHLARSEALRCRRPVEGEVFDHLYASDDSLVLGLAKATLRALPDIVRHPGFHDLLHEAHGFATELRKKASPLFESLHTLVSDDGARADESFSQSVFDGIRSLLDEIAADETLETPRLASLRTDAGQLHRKVSVVSATLLNRRGSVEPASPSF